MAEITRITFADMTYSFELPTTFSLKRVMINAEEEMEVYPIINGFNLKSVSTNIESDVFLEPITNQSIIMEIIGFYNRPVSVSSVELWIELF